jgi:cbb3-type cytochrome oxidase cytochrome c subunit
MNRLLFLLVFILAGCVAALPVITEKQYDKISNRWPGTTLPAVNKGRQLYIDKCAGCHSLHSPYKLTDDEWKKAINEMGLKANLTDAEKELILKYLLTAKME